MHVAELGAIDAFLVVLYLLAVVGLGLWMSWGRFVSVRRGVGQVDCIVEKGK